MTRRRRLLWVVAVGVLLVAATVTLIAVRCPTMKHDEFLGPVKSQLMRPPPTSEAALVAAAEGRRLLAGAISVPVEDDRYVAPSGFPDVHTEFWVPKTASCVGFEQELGRYDVVRCRYHVKGWQVDLAMSAHVTAIRLSAAELTGNPLAVAQQVAHRLLEPETGVVLRVDGCDGEMTFGSHDVEQTGPRVPMEFGGWQHWRDTLSWWHEPGQVGFIAINAYGVPTRIILPGAAEWANERWFSKEQPEWYFARDLERLVGPVHQQLMLPPLLLLHAAIDAVTHRAELPDGVSVVPADDATYVPRAIRGVRPEFQVPPSALCFAFEQERGRFDVLRCQYGVGPWFVTVVSTAQLMAIIMNDSDRPEGEPVANARLVAEALFEPGTKLELSEVGRVSHFTVGKLTVDTRAPSTPPDGGVETTWRDTLTWWYRRGEVGFIATKPGNEAASEPPPEVTEQANRRWFSEAQPRPAWFRPRKQR